MLSADGVTVRAFVLCCVACCWCCSCWFALLSAVGVRMARTGFKRIDIYIYILMLWRVIVARSRACVGVLVMVLCVWMYQGLFRVVLV